MSNHRPSSRSDFWEDSRRWDDDYDYNAPRSRSGRSGSQDRGREGRSQAARSPGRQGSGRAPAGRPYADRPSSGRSDPRRSETERRATSRPSPSRSSSGRSSSGRRPVRRRRRSPLPLLLLLALLAVLVLILRSCLAGGEKPGGTGDYQLSFSSSPLIIGETGQATLEGLPEDFDGDILWSSSDASIVSVSGSGATCSLTAKAEGEASIVAIVDGVTYSSTLRIIEPGQVISQLTLNHTSEVLLSGDSLQLSASVTMEDQSQGAGTAVSWASNNLSVARVTSDGLVTARDVGTAQITATLGNQTASCEITVQANTEGEPVTNQEGYEADPQEEAAGGQKQEAAVTPPATGGAPAVTALSISQSVGFLSEGESLTLGANATPAGTAVSWSSNNPAVATVNAKGLVTAKTSGTVLISATAGNRSVSCTLTVSPPNGVDPSGIQGPSEDEQVYPDEE